VLSQRALNRATLARQYLLERAPVRAIDAIEHLAGMQSQAPLAPYVGLWTRLVDFTAGELSTLTEQRQVVRLGLMRNTVHLVSARDCLDWRALFAGLRGAIFAGQFRRAVEGVDRDELLGQARLLLEERPRGYSELRQLLATRWPAVDPEALGRAVIHELALCQVPPRGVWGASGTRAASRHGGRVAWVPVESWLGQPLRQTPVDGLVLRYLGAFGPASVADIQLWSGLTRLREVVERLPLRQFRGAAGQPLYDLPEAPRPPEETPAPPRFLPEYDNLLLSYRDRTRVILDGRPVPLPPGNGASSGTLLVDGVWQGTWHVRPQPRVRAQAQIRGQARIRGQALIIEPFTGLRRADRDAVLAEAARLCEFLAPEARYDIVVEKPTS
jgi:hypothetical protein